MDRRILFAFMMLLTVPYGCSMALLGNVPAKSGETEGQEASAKTADPEACLPFVVAGQISAESHPEAMKAQAVLARTYIRRQMEELGMEEEIPESVLELEKYGENQLKKRWGTEAFPEYYSRFERAVRETAGITLIREGRLIDPLFTHTTAGATRPGGEEYPYLVPVSCIHDPESEDFVQEISMKPEEAAACISGIPAQDGAVRSIPPEAFPEQVQIISRDESGYVKQLQIAGFPFDGEEVRLALGLPSACFELSRQGEKICFTTRGRGHGWGLSQTEAQAMAEDGWRAEEILEYFYTGISFSSE